MKERPINFRAWEVRAIREGRKTQFRRVVNPQPEDGLVYRGVTITSTIKSEEGSHLFTDAEPVAWKSQRIHCPYGQPGAKLWVRECHYVSTPRHDGDTGSVEYRADYCDELAEGILWKPSVQMPRWASRITLEVISVRVERLNEISEEDAKAEGGRATLNPLDSVRMGAIGTHREGFSQVWQSDNGPGSWEANPWVWAVEFRVIKP